MKWRPGSDLNPLFHGGRSSGLEVEFRSVRVVARKHGGLYRRRCPVVAGNSKKRHVGSALFFLFWLLSCWGATSSSTADYCLLVRIDGFGDLLRNCRRFGCFDHSRADRYCPAGNCPYNHGPYRDSNPGRSVPKLRKRCLQRSESLVVPARC